jgi:NAD(P)-dependent dehydrogenase (short-subunit alcohol dehydrogenase family)
MNPRFDGKVVIVTGGGGGYGAAFAQRFASEGASVVVADLRLEEAERVAATLPNAIAVPVDVTSMDATERMAATVLDRLGRIDVLINNAGGSRAPKAAFFEMEEKDWDFIIDLNLKGQWLAARAVFGAMRDQGGGKIVNMASGTATSGKPPGRAHYIAAKAGVIGLTRALAVEAGPFNIQVNCVFPGYMPFPTHGEDRDALLEDHRKNFGGGLLTKPRSVEPVAGTVAFLASSDADSMTGQTVNTDGGTQFV